MAQKTERRFAYDSFRRLLDMFGDVVLGIPHALFEEEIQKLKKARKVPHVSL
jgi:pyruvate,orthophosphate dikinase